MKKLTINIIGEIFGTDGYSSHTRNLANALSKVADCKLSVRPVPNWEKLVNDAEFKMLTQEDKEYDYNLIISTPHNWKLFTGLGKNIGYCVWEGSHCPLSWVDDFKNERINLIFTPSNHTKQAILNTLDISNISKEKKEKIINKIHIIPHGVNPDLFYECRIKEK